MKKLIISALISLACSTTYAADYSLNLSEPSKAANIEINVVLGSVKVVGYSGKTVEITTDLEPLEVVESDDSDDKKLKGLKLVTPKSPQLIMEEDGNNVEINSLSRKRAVHFTIKVPNTSNLDIRVGKGGDITVSDVNGELDLISGQGGIYADKISGPIVAESGKKGIKVQFTRFEQKSPSSLISHKGDVDVSLPAKTTSDISLQTFMGEVYTGFEIPFVSEQTANEQDSNGKRIIVGGSMIGKLNGGGQKLTLSSYKGDIYIRKM
ncbi:hypothetical protein ACSLBF_20965 (plasmid) [Pseudoalteromonas sp. T1lg65]|uniref:hypothetical protein n=1 Tax=Pseudoalteromonas sp. T1lg65 TaxID=2077101 RepID=UPI003F798DEC